MRHGGRGDEQDHQLSGGSFTLDGDTAGDPGAIEFGSGQNFAHGSGAGVSAGRAARRILGHGSCSKMGVLRDETLDRIATESGTTHAGKDRIFGTDLAFVQPGIQHPRRFWEERRATLFSAFSEAADMGSGAKHNILAVQPSQLGNPQSGLGCD